MRLIRLLLVVLILVACCSCSQQNPRLYAFADTEHACMGSDVDRGDLKSLGHVSNEDLLVFVLDGEQLYLAFDGDVVNLPGNQLFVEVTEEEALSLQVVIIVNATPGVTFTYTDVMDVLGIDPDTLEISVQGFMPIFECLPEPTFDSGVLL